MTLEGVSVDRLSALFKDWPAGDRRRAMAQVGKLLDAHENCTVRLDRENGCLRIEELSTGADLVLHVPEGC